MSTIHVTGDLYGYQVVHRFCGESDIEPCHAVPVVDADVHSAEVAAAFMRAGGRIEGPDWSAGAIQTAVGPVRFGLFVDPDGGVPYDTSSNPVDVAEWAGFPRALR